MPVQMSVEADRARTIVVIEWVLFALSVLLIGFLCLLFKDTLFKSSYYHDSDQTEIQLIFFSILTVALFIAVAINVVLTVGVHKEHSTCCKVWWVINIISIVFNCLDVLANLVTLNLLGLPIAIAVLCYRIYAGKTIKAFTDKLAGLSNVGVVYSATPITGAADQGELVYHPPPPYNQLEVKQKC